jgi:hypothetical protein
VHVALQQSLDCEQFWPALRHASPSQTPAVHDMLQQSLYEEQEAPPARHLPAEPVPLVPESPPTPPSLPEPLLPPLPPSMPLKPLPWAPLLPAHPSPDATTKGSTDRTVKIAQERLMALRTKLIAPSPRHKAVGTLQRQATPGPMKGNVGYENNQ